MKVVTDWQARSMERLAEDAKDCTEMMARCAGSFAQNEMEAVEEIAESTKKMATTRHATPV